MGHDVHQQMTKKKTFSCGITWRMRCTAQSQQHFNSSGKKLVLRSRPGSNFGGRLSVTCSLLSTVPWS